MTLTELKAAVYDELLKIEIAQARLRELNKQIAEWKEPPKQE